MTKLFGTTIKETIDAFKPAHLGKTSNRSTKNDRIITYSRIAISIILLFAATFLFIKDNDSSKVGAAIFGTIMGYWLK